MLLPICCIAVAQPNLYLTINFLQMSTVTIASFNCENLFRRYKFNKNLSKEQVEQRIKDGFIIDKTVLTTVNETERQLTADAIKATKADIVCLQEVENLDT